MRDQRHIQRFEKGAIIALVSFKNGDFFLYRLLDQRKNGINSYNQFMILLLAINLMVSILIGNIRPSVAE